MQKPIRIVTHSGTFHADELLATATLEIFFNGAPYEVIRSRDPEVVKTGDYVLDVGFVYDHASHRYDHHQAGGAGARGNGVPYSSFGLVWKHFGTEICGSQEVADAIDRRLVQPIDMADNMIEVYKPTSHVHPYILHNIVMAFRPTWKEGESYDTHFKEMVIFLKQLLEREIKTEQDNQEGAALVERIYEKAEDKRLIVLDGQYPWHNVLAGHPEPLYVVKPKHQSTQWEIECVRTDTLSFGNRKALPAAWAGLNDGKLIVATGVPDAVFCHNQRYVAVAETKEGVLKLAELALHAPQERAPYAEQLSQMKVS